MQIFSGFSSASLRKNATASSCPSPSRSSSCTGWMLLPEMGAAYSAPSDKMALIRLSSSVYSVGSLGRQYSSCGEMVKPHPLVISAVSSNSHVTSIFRIRLPSSPVKFQKCS